MVLTTIAAAIAGMATVGGLILLVAELRGHDPRNTSPSPSVADRVRGYWRQTRPRTIRVAGAIAAGLAVWLITTWPVAGVATAAAIAGLPILYGSTRAARKKIDRLEGLESWTRRLADLSAAGGGLEQALATSMRTCPAAIKPHVDLLAARLRAGWDMNSALYGLADDLNEAPADLVVAVLLRHAERRGAGLTAVLTDLADTVAEEVALRRKVEADRTKPRTTARWVTAITLAITVLGLMNPDYVEPYSTLTGQVVLSLIAAAFAGCLVWMYRVTQGKPEPRLLANRPNLGGDQ